ncbi:MAG TPA: M55 family metallopeptidase [Acidobacteriota bacterium]|nr:M55 family metallopeptidase [Acidobacteriota bacterium]
MRRSALPFAVAAVLALAPAWASAQARPKLKVFISVDMEGIWGVVHADQTSPGTAEYAAARKWMAEDVNAAIRGLLAAGPAEIVVNDSHGSMRNIDPAGLDLRASLITGSPKPLSMMQGIDPSFQACLLIGYHAKAGTENAILDHTISSSVVRFIKVNGAELPELGLNAAIAGSYGVPVVLVSGDTAVCRQAAEVLGRDVVTVAVKEAFGRTAARLLPRDEVWTSIESGAKEAIARLDRIKPFKMALPCRFELGYHVSAQADMGAMLLPNVSRVDARTLAFTADDYIAGFKTLRALIALAPPR